MKSRAVILSSVSKVLLNYWLREFVLWEDKVDKVYVGKDFPGEFSCDNPKVQIIEAGKYPKNLTTLINQSNEELLLIMHDDVFIYRKNILDVYFKIAEYEVISPEHQNYANSDNTRKRMIEKFGTDISFYPYFCFVSRENALKTSLNFSSYSTMDNEDKTCPILGLVEGGVGGDQGFLFVLELLNAGVKIFRVDRYLGSDEGFSEKRVPWVHV